MESMGTMREIVSRNDHYDVLIEDAEEDINTLDDAVPAPQVHVANGGLNLPSILRRRNFDTKWIFLVVVVLTFVVVVSVIAAFATQQKHVPANEPNADVTPALKAKSVCTTKSCILSAASMLQAMDMNIDYCEDFYSYACGGWMAKTQLPAGMYKWSVMDEVRRSTKLKVKSLVETEAKQVMSFIEKDYPVFYKSCMDEEVLANIGASELLEFLNTINWNSSDLDSILGQIHLKTTISPFFTVAIKPDTEKSSLAMCHLFQPTFGLPARDYYVTESPENKKVLSAYLEYMVAVNELLLGEANSTIRPRMKAVLELEKSLANILEPLEKQRDVMAFQKIKLGDLQKNVPFFKWAFYLQTSFGPKASFANDDPVVVYEMEYFNKLNGIVANTNIRVIKDFIKWTTVRFLVELLDGRFVRAKEVLEKTLYGASQECLPRWQFCLQKTEEVIGFAVSVNYVNHTTDMWKAIEAEKIMKQVHSTFLQTVQNVTWMAGETKTEVKRKVSVLNSHVGFPFFYLHGAALDFKYFRLKITNASFFHNMLSHYSAQVLGSADELRIGTKKYGWKVLPHSTEPSFNPVFNKIFIPLGILQSPIFNIDDPKFKNYAALGTVMAREIIHIFDDEGRKYNVHGNLNSSWWTRDSIENFEKLSGCFSDQYGKYKVGDENVNGRQTLGENIADNGGVRTSFRAYENYLKEIDAEENRLPIANLTNQQLFFVAYAQSLCSIEMPQDKHKQLLADEHSPARFRVIGSLSNFPEFAKHFNCSPGSKMNPVNKCHLW
uniref:endothelin-converting enzyme 1-like n=1 Tax=Myxine glutinosa TaxID=7769 RepID=UPI00358E4DAF